MGVVGDVGLAVVFSVASHLACFPLSVHRGRPSLLSASVLVDWEVLVVSMEVVCGFLSNYPPTFKLYD